MGEKAAEAIERDWCWQRMRRQGLCWLRGGQIVGELEEAGEPCEYLFYASIISF